MAKKTVAQRMAESNAQAQAGRDVSFNAKGAIGTDIASGIDAGQGILGADGLGRLGGDEQILGVLDQFEDIANNGLSTKELEGKRAQAFQGIDRNTQTSLRGLQGRLARSGVKGGIAAKALLQAQGQGDAQKGNVERDLFLESASIQRQGLKDFSQRLGNVKQFDLAQRAKEKDLLLQSGLGVAKLGSGERNAERQAAAARDAARVQAEATKAAAAAQSGGGGGGKK